LIEFGLEWIGFGEELKSIRRKHNNGGVREGYEDATIAKKQKF